MPILMRTPDINAETWLRAIACAPGNHMCSGMRPALKPKPISPSRKIAVITPGATATEVRGVNWNEPVAL